jgi:hypothetical protein
MDEIWKMIKELAEKEMGSDSDDFDPSDGGNYDDAYSLGKRDGEIGLARELLSMKP